MPNSINPNPHTWKWKNIAVVHKVGISNFTKKICKTGINKQRRAKAKSEKSDFKE